MPFLIFLLLIITSLSAEGLKARAPAPKSENFKVSKLSDPKAAVVVFDFQGNKGSVKINGNKVCQNQARCSGEIPKGEYVVDLQSEGFLDSSYRIYVPNGTNYYPTTLLEKPGILSLSTVDSKSGAILAGRVFIDDREVGTTPWSGAVSAETKSVGVRLRGYQEVIITERPPRRKELSFTVKLAPTKTSSMKKLEKGCFEMGSEDGKKDEKPVHKVCISSFYMDKYEVTHAQFKAAMGQDYSYFANCGEDCPAESMTWKQAVTYCDKVGKRLPTEAEWEYAARAGSGSKWGCGIMSACLGGVAWTGGNSGGRVHPVGQKSANSWGLYDMSGNVAEWTADWYGHTYYAFSAKQDPKGANGGDSRVVRGGSYYDKDTYMLPSVRGGFDPNFRETTIGFRCAMDAQ